MIIIIAGIFFVYLATSKLTSKPKDRLSNKDVKTWVNSSTKYQTEVRNKSALGVYKPVFSIVGIITIIFGLALTIKACLISSLERLISNIKGDLRNLLKDYTKEKVNIYDYGITPTNLNNFALCIIVASDAEKQRLFQLSTLNETIWGIFKKRNYPIDAIQNVQIKYESRETIQRESKGNWNYHFR